MSTSPGTMALLTFEVLDLVAGILEYMPRPRRRCSVPRYMKKS